MSLMRVIASGGVFLVSVLGVPECAGGVGDEALGVVDIRAHLFYQRSGRFSEDITAKPEMVLWNIPFGGGDAEEPADDLLVVVVVRAPGSFFDPTLELRLEATSPEEGRVFFEEIRGIGVTGPEGSWTVPFLLRRSTCTSMSVDVELSEDGGVYSETIDFRCGE